MKTIHIWKGSNKLQIVDNKCGIIPHSPTKIGYLEEVLVLLDSKCQLWFGSVSDSTIEFEYSDINVVDFVCFDKHVYFTNDQGKVYKLQLSNPNSKEISEIVLFEEAESCAHGHTTDSQKVNVKSISVGNMGVLFLSVTGHLWVCGEHPQLDVHKGDETAKVRFFDGRHITFINSGKDFNVAITHKRESGICPAAVNEDNKSDEGASSVFFTACSHCANENIVSPLSPQTCFDTCPLGLKLSNDSPSPSTPTSKNNTIASEDKNNENDDTSTSTECSIAKDVLSDIEEQDDNISVIVEKGEGMGLLHINTESARQFLTRQLSWVSSGGEELLAEVSVPTKIIKQNVSSVASFVYEGVKTVGDKVATLSRHMSGGSDNNSDSFDDFVTDDFNLSHASNTSSFK